MVTTLLVAVVFLTVLTLFNLILVLGLVRRLRSYETRLGDMAEPPPISTVNVGERVGDFTASTIDGRTVDRASLRAPVLVGFFSPNCSACHERLGDFRAAADQHNGDILAVVVHDGGDTAPVLAVLSGLDVVVEDPSGPLARAFGINGFPAFLVLTDGGVVESVSYQLPVLA